MTPTHLGVDLGATTTDMVALKGKRVRVLHTGPALEVQGIARKLASYAVRVQGVAGVGVTGGKSARLRGRLWGTPTTHVNEIEAIGRGALFLSGKRRALVASMGTGTCLVDAGPQGFTHMKGTPLSGGTVVGLCKALAGVDEPAKIASLARKGRAKKSDLSVGDIVGKGIGLLSASAPASNFARAPRGKADRVRGVLDMVAHSNAVIITQAALLSGQKNIVVTGKLCQIPPFRTALRKAFHLLDTTFTLPRHYGQATATGAALALHRH